MQHMVLNYVRLLRLMPLRVRTTLRKLRVHLMRNHQVSRRHLVEDAPRHSTTTSKPQVRRLG
jgi:hypothetical protein